jgi:hypothetical protein
MRAVIAREPGRNDVLEPRPPYTHDQVKILYPVLTEVECRIVANIEQKYKWWEVYPHVNYPATHLWYARRAYTPMMPLVTEMVGDIPGEIVNWTNENSSVPAPGAGE